jgi:hypothetical protein
VIKQQVQRTLWNITLQLLLVQAALKVVIQDVLREAVA